jgi:hypothetical protein
MAMSKRSGGEKQEDIWIAHTELAVAPGHPFYTRLNELLEGAVSTSLWRDYPLRRFEVFEKHKALGLRA